MNMINRIGITTLVGVGAVAGVSLANAQGNTAVTDAKAPRLEEVIVTAQKRMETVQSTAASVVSMTGDDLTESGAATGDQFIQQALQNVAGLTVQNSNITIRGINSNANANATFSPATATYVDGAYSALGSGGSPNFLATATGFGSTGGNLDTERVEVLRGPQGTLFGRSATGGIVNITTRDPVQSFEGKIIAELGSNNLQHFGGVLNVPVTDNLALRGAVDSVERDGYLNSGQNDNHERQARLKALYEVDRFSVLLAGYYEEFGSGYGGGQVVAYPDDNPPTKYKIDADAIKNDPSTVWTAYARVEADFDFATGTFVTQYGKQKTPERLRADFGLDLRDHAAIDSLYSEFHLDSPLGSDIVWVVGGNYYVLNSSTRFNAYNTGFLFFEDNNDVENKSAGVFAQATYPVTETLRLTAGVRQTKETLDQNRFGSTVGVPFNYLYEPTFNSFNYKVGVEYDLAPDHLLYFTHSTGFRAGGISSSGGRTFDAETVKAYELGSKNEFLDHRLSLNASIFYYDYPKLQAGVVQYIGGAPIDTDVRTNPARFTGAELESLLQTSENGRLNLSVSYLDARYTSLDAVSLADFGGYRIASAPEWQLAGGYQHTLDLTGGFILTLSGQASYRSDTYVVQLVDPLAHQPAYTLVDLSAKLGFPGDYLSVTGYVRNLTDEYYKTGGTVSKEGLDSSQRLTVGMPRTVGVALNLKF